MSEPSEPDYCDLIDRIDFLNDRVAELEAETEVWRTSNAALTSECLTLRARIVELVALHIEVVHCGGQCDSELLVKIERATQEEAGWTKFNSLSSSNTQFDH